MLKMRAFLIVACSLGIALMLSACAAVRAHQPEVGNPVAGGGPGIQAWQAITSIGVGEAAELRLFGSIYKLSDAHRATEQVILPSFHYGNCPFSDD